MIFKDLRLKMKKFIRKQFPRFSFKILKQFLTSGKNKLFLKKGEGKGGEKKCAYKKIKMNIYVI